MTIECTHKKKTCKLWPISYFYDYQYGETNKECSKWTKYSCEAADRTGIGSTCIACRVVSHFSQLIVTLISFSLRQYIHVAVSCEERHSTIQQTAVIFSWRLRSYHVTFIRLTPRCSSVRGGRQPRGYPPPLPLLHKFWVWYSRIWSNHSDIRVWWCVKCIYYVCEVYVTNPTNNENRAGVKSVQRFYTL